MRSVCLLFPPLARQLLSTLPQPGRCSHMAQHQAHVPAPNTAAAAVFQTSKSCAWGIPPRCYPSLNTLHMRRHTSSCRSRPLAKELGQPTANPCAAPPCMPCPPPRRNPALHALHTSRVQPRLAQAYKQRWAASTPPHPFTRPPRSLRSALFCTHPHSHPGPSTRTLPLLLPLPLPQPHPF